MFTAQQPVSHSPRRVPVRKFLSRPSSSLAAIFSHFQSQKDQLLPIADNVDAADEESEESIEKDEKLRISKAVFSGSVDPLVGLRHEHLL